MGGCEVGEAGANGQADEVLCCAVFTLVRHLDLEAAAAEAQVHDRLAAGELARLGIRGANTGVILADLVEACDAEVHAALANKGRDISGGEEDEGNREVLDEGNVEAVFAAELDIGAFEEIERGLVQAALCQWEKESATGSLAHVRSCW